MKVIDEAERVLRFWLVETLPERRFIRDPVLDAEIRARFGPLSAAVLADRAAGWREDPRTLLAAIILIDQFQRNLHRDSALAFAGDGLARDLTRHALAREWDKGMTAAERQFLYMPLMHSEDSEDQALSVRLFEAIGVEDAARFARLHQEQIVRFGRFPGRNEALGRVDAPEEAAFLAQPGSRF